MNFTLRGTQKSCLGKRNIILKYTLGGDMLVPSKVAIYIGIVGDFSDICKWLISPPKSICQKNPRNSLAKAFFLVFLGDTSRLHKAFDAKPPKRENMV